METEKWNYTEYIIYYSKEIHIPVSITLGKKPKRIGNTQKALNN